MQKKTLEQVLEELNQEVKFKRDAFLSPQEIRMDTDGTIIREGTRQRHHLTDWSTTQLSNRLGIPTRYLKKCPSHLMSENINYWLHNNTREDETWMLRYRDSYENDPSQGLIRGFLSEKYSPFDDNEFLEILTNIFGNSGKNYEVNMWGRDDAGFHLRITLDDLTAQIGQTLDGKPDIHKVGLHIENSEVGKKSIKIRPVVYRLICKNGLMGWSTDGDIFQQRHIHLNQREMFGRVSDAIVTGLKQGDEVLNKLLQAKETPLEQDPLSILDDIAKDKKYSQHLTDGIRTSFMEEPGTNVFYLTQAFTRAAQGLDTDSRVELERDAGRIMDKLLAV